MIVVVVVVVVANINQGLTDVTKLTLNSNRPITCEEKVLKKILEDF